MRGSLLHGHVSIMPYQVYFSRGIHRWFSGQFSVQNFEIILFCFVVAICDLVHDVATIHALLLLYVT